MAQRFEVAEDVRCVNLRERVAVAALELVADARRALDEEVDMRDGLALAHERFARTEDALHDALADGFGHVFGKMEDVHEKSPFVRAFLVPFILTDVACPDKFLIESSRALDHSFSYPHIKFSLPLNVSVVSTII